MARPLRIEIPGGIHHVYNRGNNKHNLFHTREDRRFFLEVLRETCKRFGWVCLGYCLLGNHFHLIILTTEPTMSKGMQFLNGVVGQRLNMRHHDSGPVFEGRFKSKPVQSGAYFMALCRYVARNPVKHGFCTKADDWEWSSHKAILGWVPRGFVAVETLLAQFGTTIADARVRYRTFVDDPQDPEWFDITKPVLGDEEFMLAVLPGEKESPEVPVAERFAPRPPLSELLDDPVGDEEIAVAVLLYEYSRREVADYVGCHYKTIGRRLEHWRRAHRAREAELLAGCPIDGARAA